MAPSTPRPPARDTAATTSRQWLNAKMGNSMPSILARLVCMLPHLVILQEVSVHALHARPGFEVDHPYPRTRRPMHRKREHVWTGGGLGLHLIAAQERVEQHLEL